MLIDVYINHTFFFYFFFLFHDERKEKRNTKKNDYIEQKRRTNVTNENQNRIQHISHKSKFTYRRFV